MRRLRVDRRGATLLEYAVLVAVVALGAIASIRTLQSGIDASAAKQGERIAALSAGSDVGGTVGVTPTLASDGASTDAQPASDSTPRVEATSAGSDPDSSGGPSASSQESEPKPKGKSLGQKIGDFFKNLGKKIWGVIKDFTPLGDIITLLDPKASALDKALAGAGLAASFIPGAGPGIKVGIGAAKTATKAAKGVDDIADAKKTADAASSAGKSGKAEPGTPKSAPDDGAKHADGAGAGAGKRQDKDRPGADSEACPGGVCPKPGQCFAAGTLVYTEHGDRPIETLRAGDRVWSRDELTGTVALKTVKQTFVSESRVIDLEIGDASRSEHLSVTPNHPFWLEGRGWVSAEALENTRLLWSPEGSLTGHAGASWSERTKVYNFEVEDYHTYFVGSLHAWVHNKGKDDCPPPASSASSAGSSSASTPYPKDADGKFTDPKLEESYQKYVKKKERDAKKDPSITPRDRDDWKQASDGWKNSPVARGNDFNAARAPHYPYNEVHLSNGKRVDSYDPKKKEIVERKATDFDKVGDATFKGYLDETKKKYPEGTTIRSNKYPDLDGQKLTGKHVIEVPDQNLSSKKRKHFEDMAEKAGFEIRYSPEKRPKN